MSRFQRFSTKSITVSCFTAVNMHESVKKKKCGLNGYIKAITLNTKSNFLHNVFVA